MSALQASLARRQAEAHTRANATAESVDRVLVAAWQELWRIKKRYDHWPAMYFAACDTWQQALLRLPSRTGWHLERLARWGYQRTARTLVRHVPKHKLRRVIPQLVEGRQGCLLQEDDSTGFLDLLFPPLDQDLIQRIVYGTNWQQTLASLTRLAPPEQIASILASGLAQDKSQQQIAQDLLPLVNNVRVSAQRTARTAALRVAHASQMACYEQLGDLVVGYQVHSAFKFNSRDWHKARSGTIYWKDPKPGEKGMYQCPQPPDEAPDPRERPPGAPAIAFNCLCYIVPVLS